MSQASQVTPQQLHDYVDGRLSAEERTQVAGYLAAHPEKAAEAEAYRAQIAGLHALYDDVIEEPTPERLLAELRRPARSWRRRAPVGAAFLALALISGAAGWLLDETLNDRRAAVAALVGEAQQAHRLYGGDMRWTSDVGIGAESALASSLAARLAAPVTLPRLNMAGFTLISVRLVPTPLGGGAVLIYSDAAGRPASLLIQPVATREARVAMTVNGDITTLYRIVDHVGYALTMPSAAAVDQAASIFGSDRG